MFQIGALNFYEMDRCFENTLRVMSNSNRPDNDTLTKRDLEWFDESLGYLDLVFGPDRLWCKTTLQLYWDLFDPIVETPTWVYELTWGKLKRKVETIRACREAELKSYLFFGELRYADFYTEPIGPWKPVVAKFHCGDDVAEARRSIAVGRFTASVFHMMRVVESGVLTLQAFLDGSPDPKAHFGGVLSKLENMVQKTKFEHLGAYMQSRLPFLKSVLPQLHSIKDAWRGKVVHVDSRIIPSGVFVKEKAVEIHNASLALMKNLAENLP